MTSRWLTRNISAERDRVRRRVSWQRIPGSTIVLALCACGLVTVRATAQGLVPFDSIVSNSASAPEPVRPSALVDSDPSASRDSAASQGWYTGIASGYYFPTQAWKMDYQLGGGGMFLLGEQINRHWGIQLDGNMWLLSGSGEDTWDLKVGPAVLWTPSSRAIAPFLLAGVGVDFQTRYPVRVSSIGPMIPLGLGLRFAMGGKSAFFIEARYYVLFRSVTARDIPLLVGFRLGL